MDSWNGPVEWTHGMDSWNDLVNIFKNYHWRSLSAQDTDLKQLISPAFISAKGIVEARLAVQWHGIESWTRGMDQGAILVVCRENYQWRQVGKCADERHRAINGFSLLRQWRCIWPATTCQRACASFKRVGLGFSKELSTSCRSPDHR